MRCFVSFLNFACFMSACLVYVSCAPAGDASVGLQISGTTSGNGGGLGGLTNILSQIDLPGLLRGVNSFVKLVGVFCPPLSQVLDNVIQNVTSTAFRVFGRAILSGGGLGGGSSSGGGGQKVSVVLPTFPPDEDDYEDDESTEQNAQIGNRNGDDEATTITTLPVQSSSESAISSNNESENIANIPGTLYTSSSADDESNVIKRHTRVVREAESDDQVGAESAPNPQDLSDVDIEDDQDRDKRYSAFGGDAEGHQQGGGSGNFLFDIIRLVAGSGATEEVEEKEAAPGIVEVDVHKHSETEGVPGPITRLFVIANRGIANLVQDLILRLAQTSEKLVNFKARLITSLI